MARTYSQANITNQDQSLGAAYPVTLPVFEGPLDLLLYLIEREELDISRISLVVVTDQYLRTIEALEEIEPGALADFLVVASKLLYIKSLRLLPTVSSIDDGDEEDTTDMLLQQLVEYRQFKRVAESLQSRDMGGFRVYGRLAPGIDREALGPIQPDLSNLDMKRLQRALNRALARIPTEPTPPRVEAYTITVAEQIVVVRERLQLAHKLSSSDTTVSVRFAEVVSEASSRMFVIVTFLAVLELVKQKEIIAVQEDIFGEIVLVPARQNSTEQVAETDDER